MNYYARVAELYTQLANVHWAMARNEMAANIQTLVEMPEAVIAVPEVAEPVKQETFNYPDEEAVRKVAQNFAKKHGKDVAKAIIAKYGDNLASVDPADYHALMAEMAE